MLEIGRSVFKDSGAYTSTATPFCRSSFLIEESYELEYMELPSAGNANEVIVFEWTL
jgi:hypothetical protein